MVDRIHTLVFCNGDSIPQVWAKLEERTFDSLFLAYSKNSVLAELKSCTFYNQMRKHHRSLYFLFAYNIDTITVTAMITISLERVTYVNNTATKCH